MGTLWSKEPPADKEETINLTENINVQEQDESAPNSSIKAESESGLEDGKTSNLQTSWNILNLIQGMGTLGIPYAIKVGGLFCIIFIVIIAVITNYTGGLIIDAQYSNTEDEEEQDETEKKRKKCRDGYAAIGKDVWKSYGSKVVASVQLIHLFGACILYLILVANCLEGFFPRILLTEKQCMMLAAVLVFPTAFLSNLSNIAWLSLISIMSINIVFISLISYSVVKISEWRVTSLPVANVRGTAIACCIILFSYVAHPYLPKIEGSMKNPSQYKFVANIAFMMATMTKIIFGIALACHYGDHTMQRVTNNIKTRSFKHVTDALLALSGLFSFALPTNVIMNIIQQSDVEMFAKLFQLYRLKKIMSWGERGIDLAMRVILVCLSTTVAMFLPEFSLLMAVFGSVTAVCLVICFPVHFYCALNKERLNRNQLILNYSILCLFIVVGAVGFYYSMEALVNSVRNSSI